MSIRSYNLYLRHPKGCYVYFMSPDGEDVITKIGISRDPFKRREALQCANSKRIILHTFFGPWSEKDARGIEKEIHEKLAKKRIRGEWYSIDYRVCWQFFNIKECSYMQGVNEDEHS
jgi:hypothetical protein